MQREKKEYILKNIVKKISINSYVLHTCFFILGIVLLLELLEILCNTRKRVYFKNIVKKISNNSYVLHTCLPTIRTLRKNNIKKSILLFLKISNLDECSYFIVFLE